MCATVLLVCAGAYIGDFPVPPTGLIPWFLTKGNTYLYFDASLISLQGKKSTQAQEVAGRISGAVDGEVLHQAYQVPIINSHLLHLYYFP